MDIKSEMRIGGAGAGKGPHELHLSRYPEEGQVWMRCDCGWTGLVSMDAPRIALSREDNKAVWRAASAHRAWVKATQDESVPITWESEPEVRELRSLR